MQDITRSLAALYGLRSSIHGSGKQRFVMVSLAADTAMPQGDAAAKVTDNISTELKRQAVGAEANAPGGSRVKPR